MIEVKYKFSGELTPEDVDNYGKIFDSVFGDFDRNRFDKKFIRNIYGESLFLFACDGDECVGTQVFMRNDVAGEKAYQSCDSAILKTHQGKGIFSSLVRKGVEVITDDVLIYGFPNSNSIHAFRKMGWTEKGIKRSKLFTPGRDGEIEIIDKEYAEWLFEEPSDHRYIKRGKWIYILCKRKMNCYRILGKTDAASFTPEKEKRVHLPVLFYHSENGTHGVGNLLIVYKDLPTAALIPDYKLDVDLF